MKIQVTQDDIDRGLQKDPCFCPIALACYKKFPFSRVRVDFGQLFINSGAQRVWFKMTPESRNFITNFDVHGRVGVKPTEFEFEAFQ